MAVIVLGMTIDESEEHSLKALEPNWVMVFGIVTLFSLLHFWKVPSGIVVSWVEKVMFSIF